MKKRSFPKVGDRIRLALPPRPPATMVTERLGTVLERSCGRSGALRVRWDNDGGPVVEGWLSDALWHWERSNLQLVNGSRKAAKISAPRGKPALVEDDLWSEAANPQQDLGAAPVGAFDATAEWRAALDEIDPGTGEDWEEMLAAAIGATPPSRQRPARFTPANQQGPVAPAPPPQRAAPAPVTVAAQALSSVAWMGDDILPGRSVAVAPTPPPAAPPAQETALRP
ncbi:MAG: hypothetical protein ACRD0N_03895, partial [Acidimicrobiales bacterium]